MLHRAVVSLGAAIALVVSCLAAQPAVARPQGLFRSLAVEHQLATAFQPNDIASAYNFMPLYAQGLHGEGQTIALLEVDGFNRGDIKTFSDTYHLPAISVQEFYAGGVPFKTEHSGEAAMDIEWAHALAPAAAIQVYYLRNQGANSQGWQQMGDLLRKAVRHGATIVSISLGTCRPTYGFTSTSSAFSDLAREGVGVFVSSGDSGAHPGPKRSCGSQIGVGYPAGDPSVVSVGGTSLSLTAGHAIQRETAWRLSGGGRIGSLVRPPWQIAAHIPVDRYRWAPDVAFAGDPATGVSIYYHHRWHQAGGTSLGAPCWAAAWALVEESVQHANILLGPPNPILYKIGNGSEYGLALHDITSGGNKHYHAHVGWDALTGWGTPNVAGLVAEVQRNIVPFRP